ncbi:MAG: hypothetical protein KatS3mg115_0821 [Candidatus Poribacteria bacterium]|nr:MAG: hypothetical protein KatS3mg115_0821 [Candidatus Poribacteria bacterium]
MQASLSPQSPRVRMMNAEIEALEAALNRLLNGETLAELNYKLRALPDLGTEYLRLLREKTKYETIYQTLTQELEVARLTENQERVDFNRLDVAQPDLEPVSPRKPLWASVGGLLGLIFGGLLGWIGDSLRARSPASQLAAEVGLPADDDD